MSSNINKNNILGEYQPYNIKTYTSDNDNVDNPLIFVEYSDNRKQPLFRKSNLTYNPSTNTLNLVNLNVSGTGPGIDITDTDINDTYYITFVDDVGNTETVNIDKTTTPLTYNPNTGILNVENLNGQFLTIDSTSNNSDFLLTCITPTPSTYNQMLYTDITYNPQTKILKTGKIDNCFALTSSGSNLPILFIDHTATGKQFLYNNNNFYYNPTLEEFLLQGNLTTQNISGNQLTLTSTDAGSSPAPNLILYRNSASPAINDYIGEIQFKGRNTDPADTIYAKINCVLADASSAGGQSYIETTLLKTGSPILISRLLTTELQLLNGCGLNVDSYIEGKSHCVIEGKTAIGLAVGSTLTYKLDVYDTTSFHCKSAVRSNDQTLEISSYYQAGVGQYSYLQSRQEATPTNYSNLSLNPNGGNVGIGKTNPSYSLDTLFTTSNTGFTTGTTSAIFQTTTGAGKHGVAIGGDVISGNAFIQSIFNDTSFGYNLCLQPNTGNLAIGTTSPNPSFKLTIAGRTRADGINIDYDCNHENGSTNGSSFFTCRFAGTQIGDVRQSTTSSVSFNTTSDYRLKENIIEMPSMLRRINQLRPIQFNYLDDNQDSLGFIAHEFKEIFSNNAIVSGEKDDVEKYQAIDYGKITPICIKGIQELCQKNTELQNKVLELENEINLIKQHLNIT